jgi:DNA-binding NarL/FixJ family response regulator
MNLLDVFKKKPQAENRNQTRLETLIDPVEPLTVKSSKAAGRPKILADAQIIQIMIWKTENISNCEIARRLHISESTVRKYIKIYT